MLNNKSLELELNQIKGELESKGKDIDLIFKYLHQLEKSKKQESDQQKRKRIGLKRKGEN